VKLTNEQLKTILVSGGLIKEANFNAALNESIRTGKNPVEILISQGLLTRDYFLELLADFLHVPRVKLTGQKIEHNILTLISEEISRSRNVVIFGQEKNILKAGMIDPSDLGTIEYLEKLLGRPIKPYLIDVDDLNYALAQYREALTLDFQKVIEENIKASLKLSNLSLEKVAEEMPIVAISDNLISYAASLNASDIHLEILADEVLVRFRVDGILREITRMAKEIHPALVARIKILAGLQIDEHSRSQDGRFKYKRGEEVFDIRVSVMPTMYGEKVAMRLLTGSTKPMSFSQLGMDEEMIKILEANISKTYGMILATGPTGSGKTTTLYAILNRLNRPEVNIVTIEDPIEYELKYVNQTQVNPKAGIDFSSGLRALLRQDPNIIMVGEIRDSDTANISVNAALTGHLLLSTLHTNDAATAVPRLIDLGVPPFLVSATLNAAIAQRLVRRICKNCIESYEVTEPIREAISSQLKLLNRDVSRLNLPKQLYRGKGCQACNFTGYRGQVAIYEIFNVDEKIREFIQSKNFSLDGLKKLGAERGMKTMFEDGLNKAQLGITTIEEVLRVIRE
jgi:type IV pilus assembly protein PilB